MISLEAIMLGAAVMRECCRVIDWRSVVSMEQQVLMARKVQGDLTLAQIWEAVEASNMVEDTECVGVRPCAHGCVLVLEPEAALDLPTYGLWRGAMTEGYANVCSECTDTLVRERVPVAAVSACASRVRIGGQRMCLEGTPTVGELVLQLKDRIGMLIDKPVSLIRQTSHTLHVEYSRSGGLVTVAALVASLIKFPSDFRVAGSCGALTSMALPDCSACRQVVRESRPRLTDDLSSGCSCGAVALLPWRWARASEVGLPGYTDHHRQLSSALLDSTVVVYSRKPMVNMNAAGCKVLDLGSDAFVQAKTHVTEAGARTFAAAGPFVEVYVEPGAVFECDNGAGIVRFGPMQSPIVLGALGALSLRFLSPVARVVLRSRGPQAKVRWEHQVACVDSRSTFARFWSLFPGALGVFNLGKGQSRDRGPGLDEVEFREWSEHPGVGVSELCGTVAFDTGTHGSVVCARDSLEVECMTVHPGASVVFAGRGAATGVRVKSLGVWSLYSAEDDYALDDGGPSDDDGVFPSEF